MMVSEDGLLVEARSQSPEPRQLIPRDIVGVSKRGRRAAEAMERVLYMIVVLNV